MPNSIAIQLIAAGDEAAERAFVEEHRPRLLRFLASRGIGQPVADDLLQEVFLAVFIQIRQGRFRGDSNVQTWVISILNNKVKDFRATRNRLDREVQLGDVEIFPTPGLGNVDSAARAVLLQLLEMLPVRHRVILLLHETEGWTIREIAERLKMKAGTVGRTLSEAKSKLHELGRTQITPQQRYCIDKPSEPKKSTTGDD